MLQTIAETSLKVCSQNELGTGGEATVYIVPGTDTVYKRYHRPDDPAFAGRSKDQIETRKIVAHHLAYLQRKLPHFPAPWSPRVVSPERLVLGGKSEIVGYTMMYVRGATLLRKLTKKTLRPVGMTHTHVVRLILRLLEAFAATHSANIVLGDTSPANIMIVSNGMLEELEPAIIDVDSAQFEAPNGGIFMCDAYTPRYVDPRLCKPGRNGQELAFPHDRLSDLYALCVMAFEMLLFMHPYNGVHEPKKGSALEDMDDRIMARKSVLCDDVRRPASGLPLEVLPADLLHYYEQLLHHDMRGEFPKAMFESLKWRQCPACGTEIAVATCPKCRILVAIAAQVIDGALETVELYTGKGLILRASVVGGKLVWLSYSEPSSANGSFVREGGNTILSGKYDSGMRFGFLGEDTVLATGEQLFILTKDGKVGGRFAVSRFHGEFPVFATNGDSLFYVANGQLLRYHPRGSKAIASVLENNTRIWVGPKFGLAFSTVGLIQKVYVFDLDRPGLVPVPAMPTLVGKIFDANCLFDGDRAWFMISSQEAGVVSNHCFTIRPNGEIVAKAHANEDDGSWLGTIYGKCALTLSGTQREAIHVLFSGTEGGLVRVQEDGSSLIVVAAFPKTKNLINTGTPLLVGDMGLVAFPATRSSALLVKLK